MRPRQVALRNAVVKEARVPFLIRTLLVTDILSINDR